MKIRVKTVNVVDSADFANAVAEFFSVDGYSFEAAEDAANDTSYEFVADGRLPNSYEMKRLEGWLAGDFVPPSATTLLNQMVSGGVIPAGMYLISVCY